MLPPKSRMTKALSKSNSITTSTGTQFNIGIVAKSDYFSGNNIVIVFVRILRSEIVYYNISDPFFAALICLIITFGVSLTVVIICILFSFYIALYVLNVI